MENGHSEAVISLRHSQTVISGAFALAAAVLAGLSFYQGTRMDAAASRIDSVYVAMSEMRADIAEISVKADVLVRDVADIKAAVVPHAPTKASLD